MNENKQVFENEEAERFLDYFVAYKKLASIIDNAKCMAAVNSDVSLNKKESTLPNSNVNDISDLHLSTVISLGIDK